jgi:hypothetical protein
MVSLRVWYGSIHITRNISPSITPYTSRMSYNSSKLLADTVNGSRNIGFHTFRAAVRCREADPAVRQALPGMGVNKPRVSFSVFLPRHGKQMKWAAGAGKRPILGEECQRSHA